MELNKMSTSDVILLKNVRLSFPHIFKAQAKNPGDTLKFSMQALIDPETKEGAAQIEMLQEKITELAVEKWGNKASTEKGLKKIVPPSKRCLRDHENDEKDYDSHEGMWYVAMSNSEDRPPKVLDQYKKPVTAADDVVYGGCYCHVTLTLWAQDNTYGQRINANLRAVMFAGDGERFGGGVPVGDDEFDDVEAEEIDADDLLGE